MENKFTFGKSAPDPEHLLPVHAATDRAGSRLLHAQQGPI
jgi:hypothetical protein